MNEVNKEKILNYKLHNFFPDGDMRERALAILGRYGTDRHEIEIVRIHLAVLKISGTDLKKMTKIVERAKQDFRDILMWAEYPRQNKKYSMPDGAEKQKIIEADTVEYDAWLKE